MSLSTRIAPFLPYLRRYSRALTGSQTSGDAYVAAVLEALITDVSIFPEASNDRVALFQLYTKLFGSSSVLIPEPGFALCLGKARIDQPCLGFAARPSGFPPGVRRRLPYQRSGRSSRYD